LPKKFSAKPKESKNKNKKSKIMDLKFSSDGEYLIAAAVENDE